MTLCAVFPRRLSWKEAALWLTGPGQCRAVLARFFQSMIPRAYARFPRAYGGIPWGMTPECHSAALRPNRSTRFSGCSRCRNWPAEKPIEVVSQPDFASRLGMRTAVAAAFVDIGGIGGAAQPIRQTVFLSKRIERPLRNSMQPNPQRGGRLRALGRPSRSDWRRECRRLPVSGPGLRLIPLDRPVVQVPIDEREGMRNCAPVGKRVGKEMISRRMTGLYHQSLHA